MIFLKRNNLLWWRWLFIIFAFFAFTDSKQAAAVEKQDSKKKEYIRALTEHYWCNISSGMFGSSVSYQLRPDGTYSHRVHTDVPEVDRHGFWNIEQAPDKTWLLLTDDGQRQPITIHSSTSISIGREGGGNLSVCKNEKPKLPPVSILPILKIPDFLVEAKRKLTAHRWKKSNDLFLFYLPTQIEFKDDFTYTTTYRNGECQNTGNWQVMSNRKSLILFSANDDKAPCDTRNSRYGESIAGRMLANGNLLTQGDDYYVPENEVLKKNIIWRIFGYDVADIQVQYETPIKAGAPNKIDVKITHAATSDEPGPLTLQKFQILKEPPNSSNDNQTIASYDLHDYVLQPGQSRSFSLDVIFPEKGQNFIYIGVSMYGSRQAWNTYESYDFNVK